MNRATVEIYLYGHTWVAHRLDGHDCADGDTLHGMADTETGALRRLIRSEAEATE